MRKVSGCKSGSEKSLKIHESAEMYLETIFVLSKTSSAVRSIDVVNELNYTKPSVSVAMRNLREKGYINIDDNGFINLTETGRQVAETIYERHNLITDVLVSIGVKKETAMQDACKIEHIISNESFEAIKEYVKNKDKQKT
jgi:Mn-dependent DtxR family transcriptional regulator